MLRSQGLEPAQRLVYPLHGVRSERDDPGYGELVAIDHLPDLIMAIAFSLVRKPDRLTGAEMRLPRVCLHAAG